MRFEKMEILNEGNATLVNALNINEQTIVSVGKYLQIARLKDEWYEDIYNPEVLINVLKNSTPKPDIITFWQRVPESSPKYNYFMEWVNIAAIPISTYDHWWYKQINDKTRNMVRKSEKKGVEFRYVDFNDNLIKGIMNIFNESPVKRGKPHRHYGKDFLTVKKQLSDVLEKSQFIGAYYENELIGFIKLITTDRGAMLSVILPMMKHRDKSPINGLLAKAVEFCAHKRIPYLTYSTWRRGTMGQFQKYNGFQKISVPRYYIPLSVKGKLALRLKLHHGIKGILPEKVIVFLIKLKSIWYTNIYAKWTRLVGWK